MTASPRHLSIRGVDPSLAGALEAERRRRGTSLNRTVLDLLAASLGVRTGSAPVNGLQRHAGTWSEAEHAEFEAAVASLDRIDDEAWQ